MLLGIFVSLGNTDPISIDFTPSVILGLSIVVGAIAYFAAATLKGHALFGFGSRTLLRNLGWHIFVLTGIIFLSHLFFRALISILVVSFQVPIFDASCKLPSERDVCLFVWDAMASGAFKFLTKYLDLAAPGCALNANSDAASAIAMSIKLFTSLVLVWFALSLAKAWYRRLRSP
jgi:hypothetical protein